MNIAAVCGGVCEACSTDCEEDKKLAGKFDWLISSTLILSGLNS